MKHKGQVAILVLVMLLALSSLAGAREKIEFWVGHDSWVPYIMHFNATQDVYEIEWVMQGSYDALIAAVAAGTPPDIFRTGEMLDLAASGILQPLDHYIERDEFDLSGFIPGILRSLQWKGSYYALPLNGDSRLVYYNKERFEEAGMDSSVTPSNWDELEETARRLNIYAGDGSLEQIGFTWRGNTHMMTGFLHQHLESLYNQDLTDIAFDNPITNRVLSWIVDSQNQINGGQANVDQLFAIYNNDLRQGFISGVHVMEFSTPSSMAHIGRQNPELRYGVFPLPIDEGGRRVSVSGGHRVAIPVGAKNPDGAWEFMKWLTSFEQGMQFAEPGFSTRYVQTEYQGIGQSMSARIDVNLTAPFYRETEHWREFAQDMVYAIEYPIHPSHPAALNALHNNLLLALRQEISVGEAITQAAHTARVELSRWE